jgi:hypothetical protein
VAGHGEPVDRHPRARPLGRGRPGTRSPLRVGVASRRGRPPVPEDLASCATCAPGRDFDPAVPTGSTSRWRVRGAGLDRPSQATSAPCGPALPDQRDLAGRCRRRAQVVRARVEVRAGSVKSHGLAFGEASRRLRRVGRIFSVRAASGSRGCSGAATRASGTRNPVAARSGSDPGTPERPPLPRSSRRRG